MTVMSRVVRGGAPGREAVRTLAVAALTVGLVAGAGAERLSAQGSAEEDSRPGVAVFAFENGGSFGPDREDLEALEVGLQQMLLTELGQSSDLRIVERSVLRDLMEEQDLGASGRVDPETAARIGQLVGARYIITGVFMDLSGDFRMDTRLVDVETGEILGTHSVRDRRDNLYSVLVEMAALVVEGADLPPLSAEHRESRESREIPAQAITLYSRAQVLEDVGQTGRARELYQRIVDDFPEMTEAGEALRQLPVG